MKKLFKIMTTMCLSLALILPLAGCSTNNNAGSIVDSDTYSTTEELLDNGYIVSQLSFNEEKSVFKSEFMTEAKDSFYFVDGAMTEESV